MGFDPSVSPAASHLPCKGRPWGTRSFAFTPQKHSRSAHCRSHYSLFLHLSAASSQASYHSHPCCVMFCLHERSFTALLLLPHADPFHRDRHGAPGAAAQSPLSIPRCSTFAAASWPISQRWNTNALSRGSNRGCLTLFDCPTERLLRWWRGVDA